MPPTQLSLLLRHFTTKPRPLFLSLYSLLLRHSSLSTDSSSSPPPDPNEPASLRARLSFVFNKIDQLGKDRADALHRICAWCLYKQQPSPPPLEQQPTQNNINLRLGFSNAIDNEAEGLGVVSARKIEVEHPWPEWVELMERLVKQNSFDHKRENEDKIVPGLGEHKDQLGLNFDFTKVWKSVQNAMINFFDILRSLSGQDIQKLVGYGCSSADKIVAFSSKPLRKHAHIDEGDMQMDFAKNSVCLRCDAKRPKIQQLPGEWECPQCDFPNYRRNMYCFNCEYKRSPDDYVDNEAQGRQSRPRMRLERVPVREQVSNAWNFDFDEDESDEAGVAAFGYADPRAMNEDHHLDSAPKGHVCRPQHDYGVGKTSKFLERRCTRPAQMKRSMGFNDLDDEEDDIDSFTCGTYPSIGGSSNCWKSCFGNSQRNIHSNVSPLVPSGEYFVLKTSNLQHWFKNWQELRKNRLTVSTFVSAIGFWPPSIGGSSNCWKSCFGNSRRNIHSNIYPLVPSGEYSVLKASNLQHWFKNWQDLRKNKLTASTFGSAIGFWPQRRVQLWLEKIGAIEPFTGNLATCWSNIKEQEALERYKLITGNNILFPEFQVLDGSSEDDWLAASADGVVDTIVYDLPSRGVLEVKCPFFSGNMSQAFPWRRIPLHCIPQAQGLLEIMDKDWMDFYVWTPNGSSLFRLYRDEEYWDTLKLTLHDFWWNHVQPAKEIYNNSGINRPLTQVAHLKPEPRHEFYSYIVYESKRLAGHSKLLVREINGRIQDCL